MATNTTTAPATGTTATTNTPAAPSYPNQVTGMYILARALKNIGIDVVYGLVGIPVTEAAYLIQEQDIRFISFRHEQQAGMAAATHGYLTKQPGVLLTVSSLGFLNGLTSTINATVNCYPMIQISGSSERTAVDLHKGAYEELDQFAVAESQHLVKAAFRVNRAEDIPLAVVRAYRAAVSGRPGGVYLDITTQALGQIMDHDAAEALIYQPVDLTPEVIPSPTAIDRAMQLLASAKQPAILIGKGAAYAQVEDELLKFVESTNIPFYPMSMAKGVISDKHPLSALSCRSTIMEKADVVMLVGARLNWMLSNGKGKWSPDTKFIQLDIDPQEIDSNRAIAAPVVGDLKGSLDAMIAELPKYKFSIDPNWVPSLQAETKTKNAKFLERLVPQTVPMTHWSALSAVKKVMEANPDVILVNEGANTLDDTRDAIDMALPRHRIDCATWAIMGMGMGSAIGAAVATGKSVVAVEGDSAFGFSGMDFSSIVRFKLPITVVIFNNGGIYNGIGVDMGTTGDPAPTTLDINARYDKLADAFGAKNYYVTTPDELAAALAEAIASKEPCLIDAQLAADAGKESGHIGYLNPAPLQDVIV